MGLIWKENAVNQIMKGTVLFEADEEIHMICLILKGRVTASSTGAQVVLGTGSFLGVTDIYMGRYLSTCTALDDLMVYAFPIKNASGITDILGLHPDYRGLMVSSMIKYLSGLSAAEEMIHTCADSVFQFLRQETAACIKAAAAFGIPFTKPSGLEQLKPYEEEFGIEKEKLIYYKDCAKIPQDVMKTYFSYSIPMAQQHVRELSGLIAQMMVGCMEASEYLKETVAILIHTGKDQLFQKEVDLAIAVKRTGGKADEIIGLLDRAIDEINKAEKVLETYAGMQTPIDREQMELLYVSVLTGETTNKKDAETITPSAEEEIWIQAMTELTGSMQQILECSKLENEKKARLQADIEYLFKASDRQSQEDEMRQTKREIASLFYELYYQVFLYSQKQKLPKAAELFLNFGFLDERLLDEKQLLSLLQLNEETEAQEGICPVYTLREWLQLVYDGTKDPSKTEFDEDYKEVLRKQKLKGEITEEQEKELFLDKEKRLSFEIKNMFAYNNRLLNGQPSTYVPILYKEQLFREPQKLLVTKKMLNESVAKLLEVDYSIFYREGVYSKPELRIHKEFIMKQVVPDLILFPVIGSNASMWQDITGRKRDSAGRFLFPRFSDASIPDLMLKMFGRFHWELCRTIQGSAWNNIKYKSLTSEYMDYLQFYKKNHDLSEEKKEKLKIQIQRGRNNSREVFLQDYEAWMKGEATGAMRLNKVSREMLATYVPFAKTIRERLSSQPLFEEAMSRYNREKAKKVHELELRFHALKKDNVELTPELIETMKYYKEL